jgi:hypothetical protein
LDRCPALWNKQAEYPLGYPGSLADDVEACEECASLARKARGMSEDTGLPPSSAKIRMLLKLLRDIEDRSKSREKTIVFSQVRGRAARPPFAPEPDRMT